jgi:hypothetical protein
MLSITPKVNKKEIIISKKIEKKVPKTLWEKIKAFFKRLKK